MIEMHTPNIIGELTEREHEILEAIMNELLLQRDLVVEHILEPDFMVEEGHVRPSVEFRRGEVSSLDQLYEAIRRYRKHR